MRLRDILIAFGFGLVSITSVAWALPIPWNRPTSGFVDTLYQGDTARSLLFKATSTSAASIFPYASSTAFTADTICLTSDLCRTTWPSGGLATTSLAATWPIVLTTSSANATYSWDGLSTTSPWTIGQLAYVSNGKLLASVATGTLSATSPLSLSGTTDIVGTSRTLTISTSGTWSGNAGTATALAANGANCSSGNAPLGVDASGASESCFDVWTEAENTSAAYTPQSRTISTTYPLLGGGDLTTNRTLSLDFGTTTANTWNLLQTFSNGINVGGTTFTSLIPTTRALTIAGTANQITSSAGAQDLSADRTWTLSLPSHVIFPSSFKASLASTTNATSTNFDITGLLTFNGITASTWAAFCTTITGGAGLCDGTDATGAGGSGSVATATQPTIGHIPYWTTSGATPELLSSIATTTQTFSGPFTLSATQGALVGGSNATITWTGLSTTTQPASSNLLVSNGAAGVFGVATSTLTASSPLTGSFVQVGSGGSLGCQTGSASQAGCIAAVDWTKFNMKVGTSSAETAGQLAAWGTTNGSPANLYSVATTAVACSGFITCTGFNALGAASTITTTGQLAVASGGTNASSLASHMMLAFDGTSIVASSTPTFARLLATSTNFSIFTGGFLSLASSTFTSGLVISPNITNGIGIGTSSPTKLFGVAFGTSTVMQGAQFAISIASSTTAAASETVNWENGNTQRYILSTNTNFVINATSSNPRDGGKYSLTLCQDPTGSRTATFITPGQLRWRDDATTTITATANRCSTIYMQYDATYSIYRVKGSTTPERLR